MHTEFSDFTKLFAKANRLEITRWRFEPGMRHGDALTWWGKKAPRRHVHHGLDFAAYESVDGSIHKLEAGMRVPLPAQAKITAIMEDFIGHTVVCVHEEHGERLLVGLYGHVRPIEGITENVMLKAGAVIAELVDPEAVRKNVPVHLHMSFALLPKGMDLKTLNWDYLNKSKDVERIDPGGLAGLI